MRVEGGAAAGHFNLLEHKTTLQGHPAALFASNQSCTGPDQFAFALGKSATPHFKFVLGNATLFCFKTTLFYVNAALQNEVSSQVALRHAFNLGLCNAAKTHCSVALNRCRFTLPFTALFCPDSAGKNPKQCCFASELPCSAIFKSVPSSRCLPGSVSICKDILLVCRNLILKTINR